MPLYETPETQELFEFASGSTGTSDNTLAAMQAANALNNSEFSRNKGNEDDLSLPLLPPLKLHKSQHMSMKCRRPTSLQIDTSAFKSRTF